MGEAVRQGRWTAEIEGDFVVFLINARPSWRLIRSIRDLGGRSMQQMLDYMMMRPEKGLLAYQQHGPFLLLFILLLAPRVLCSLVFGTALAIARFLVG